MRSRDFLPQDCSNPMKVLSQNTQQDDTAKATPSQSWGSTGRTFAHLWDPSAPSGLATTGEPRVCSASHCSPLPGCCRPGLLSCHRLPLLPGPPSSLVRSQGLLHSKNSPETRSPRRTGEHLVFLSVKSSRGGGPLCISVTIIPTGGPGFFPPV